MARDEDRGPISQVRQRVVQRRMAALYEELGTYGEVADLLNLSGSYVGAIVNGKQRPGVQAWEALKEAGLVDNGDDPMDEANDDVAPPGEITVEGDGDRPICANGYDAPDTVPELLVEVRRSLDDAACRMEAYIRTRDPSPFALGGLKVLQRLVQQARDGATL